MKPVGLTVDGVFSILYFYFQDYAFPIYPSFKTVDAFD